MTILPPLRTCHEEKCGLSEPSGGHFGHCGHFTKCLSSYPLVSEDFSYLLGCRHAFAVRYLHKTAKTAKVSSCADRKFIDG